MTRSRRGWEGKEWEREATNQEYTSSAGGNIFFPASCSFFKNLFNSKKSLLVISSFNSFNQLSCRVPISNARRSFCSALNVLTHASLSNFFTGVEAVAGLDEIFLVVVPVTFVVDETVLGGPKNEVMEPLALGFFASESVESVALRLSDMMIDGRRNMFRRDSLNDCSRDLRKLMNCGGWEELRSGFAWRRGSRTVIYRGTRNQRARALGIRSTIQGNGLGIEADSTRISLCGMAALYHL